MGTTVFATVSTPGPPGPTGPAGYSPQFIVAAGAPSAGVGNNSDMYINSSTGDVYGPKVSGAWGGVACNIKGSTGATGAQGPAGYSPLYIVGAGAPTGAVGNNGDMYINSTTSDVYGPKTSGAWGGIQCNIKGTTGAQGPPGVAYTPKGAWSGSTTYAQGDEVTSGGQLYISLQSGNLNNNPATSPSYWQPVGSGSQQTPWLSDIDGAGFKLKNVGSIGIGTPAPDTLLTVAATANTGLMVRSTDSTFKGVVYNTNNTSMSVGTTTNHPLGLYANNVLVMSVTPAGLVGIGTATPAGALHVAYVNYEPPSLTHSAASTTIWSVQGTELALTHGGSAPNTICFQGRSAVADGSVCPIGFNPLGGSVGINTTAPGAQLEVNGCARVTGTAGIPGAGAGMEMYYGGGGVVQSYDRTAGAYKSLFFSGNPIALTGGNVGIGTTTPPEQLTLSGYGAISMHTGNGDSFLTHQYLAAIGWDCLSLACNYRRTDQNAGTIGQAVIGTAEVQMIAFAAPTNGMIQFRTGAVNTPPSIRMTIDYLGNVGVGTGAPQSQFSVIPAANPTTASTATQITVGEATNNAGYSLRLGYWQSGANYIGVIQSCQGNAGYTLQLNPGGGVVAVGNQLTVGAGPVMSAGDLGIARVNAPTTGVIYFGNTTNAYLYFDGGTFNFAGGVVTIPTSLNVNGNATFGSAIYGGAGTLNIPCLYCPPFSSNPVNMFNNTLGFTVNEGGNYVTLWVKMSNGTLHIYSMPLTTPS